LPCPLPFLWYRERSSVEYCSNSLTVARPHRRKFRFFPISSVFSPPFAGCVTAPAFREGLALSTARIRLRALSFLSSLAILVPCFLTRLSNVSAGLIATELFFQTRLSGCADAQFVGATIRQTRTSFFSLGLRKACFAISRLFPFFLPTGCVFRRISEWTSRAVVGASRAVAIPLRTTPPPPPRKISSRRVMPNRYP